MTRIVRRTLVRDPSGRPLSVQSERVTDDGQGSLQQTSERSAAWCSGCGRAVTDLAETRGLCDACRARGCCVHCLSRCQVCSRRLCGQCRRGFAGPPPLTVCSACQRRLIQRQLLQDEQAALERELVRRRSLRQEQDAAFGQELARERLLQQDRMLKFHYERTLLTARLQAARMGLALNLNPKRPPLLLRILRRMGSAATAVMHHAGLGLRGHSSGRGVPTRR